MTMMTMPGFTAEGSGGTGQAGTIVRAPAHGASADRVKQQMMKGGGGDSEELLICLGACLCCAFCKPGPWKNASCQYCNRCLGSPPILTLDPSSQFTLRWRSMQQAMTSSRGRAHQRSEKISTSA